MAPAIVGGKEPPAGSPAGTGAAEISDSPSKSLATQTYKSVAKDGCCAGSETKVEFQRRVGESHRIPAQAQSPESQCCERFCACCCDQPFRLPRRVRACILQSLAPSTTGAVGASAASSATGSLLLPCRGRTPACSRLPRRQYRAGCSATTLPSSSSLASVLWLVLEPPTT